MARQQQELPTLETPSGDDELDALAVNLKQLSKKRKRAQDLETEAREILERMMKDKKLQVYRVEEHDLLVTMVPTERAKVEEVDELAKPEADEEPDEAEPGEQRAKKKKAPNGTPAEA